MKKIIGILLVSGLAACGNKNVNKEEVEGIEAHDAKTVSTANIDPTCKMPKEAGWTDNVVKAPGDTVWFCSATCKDAYVAKNK